MNLKKINQRINLINEKTEKFKTFSLSFYFHKKLNEKDVSLNALLPYVIKKGSKNYSDMTVISNTLEELYGGNFDCTVMKKGEDQIIGFNFVFVSPKYIKNDDEYINRVYDFVFDVLFNPLTENGCFKKDYVDREKENMIDYIDGIINDKKEYAQLRCIEEMFKGDNYALLKYGSIEKIKEINEKILFDHYKKFISEGRIDIFLTGDIDGDIIEKRINELNLSDGLYEYPKTVKKQKCDNVKVVEEPLDVAQGKLTLGFTTDITAKSDKKYALSVFNSVFGSGAHSKLFNNVREKLSLCYYAYSRIDSYKGVMFVNSGVEFENFKKAYDEILVQLEDIRAGKTEEFEIDAAKKSIVNVLKSVKDSSSAYEDYLLNGLINGKIVDVSEYIDNILKVTNEEIIEVAKKVKLSTEYYLTGGLK